MASDILWCRTTEVGLDIGREEIIATSSPIRIGLMPPYMGDGGMVYGYIQLQAQKVYQRRLFALL